jgi:hypothetical protein
MKDIWARGASTTFVQLLSADVTSLHLPYRSHEARVFVMASGSHITTAQEEAYSFSKDKLPRFLSYPLKRSLLDAALRKWSVYDSIASVFYRGRQYENVVLSAHYTPEGLGNWGGKAWLTCYAVHPKERKQNEELLLSTGLPKLCEWLAKVGSEGDGWRALHHSLTLRRVGETLSSHED